MSLALGEEVKRKFMNKFESTNQRMSLAVRDD
jgi:hypothetical protein